MSSISGGPNTNLIPKDLGQLQGAQTAQQSGEVQQTKGSEGTKGIDHSRDSFTITEGSQTSDSPELADTLRPPSGAGPRADAESLGGKASFLGEVSDGALMFSALMEMARQGQRELSDARSLKEAMHQGKIQSKKDGIQALKAQHEAERNAKWVEFGAAAGAAVVNGVTAGLTGGTNTGLTNIMTQVTQLATTAATTADKQWGFARTADDKKVEIKQHERMEAIFDDSIDSAKTSYEEAKEQFKAALRIITEHAERETQVTQKLTS